MFKLIIETAVRFRWAVVFVAAVIAAYGLFQLSKLPIDAVPDITNRQVQIIQYEIDRYTKEWEDAATELEELEAITNS